MSLNLLGDIVDIHVGGIDLRFPHHEDERAQTNALAGKEVVRNWIHGEHLLFEGKKMAKSSGNVLLVSDIAARGLDPLALRLALLENRYRSQIDMTWQSITAADATLQRWRRSMAAWGSGSEIKFDEDIHRHFMNDLETAKALLRLRSIEKDESIGAQDKRAIFLFADQVLGLDLDRVIEPSVEIELSADALKLLDERAAARAAGNWAESDRIRDLLAHDGINVRDGKDGQSWELRN
jgi:cysteinyl-tRNA synthetase